MHSNYHNVRTQSFEVWLTHQKVLVDQDQRQTISSELSEEEIKQPEEQMGDSIALHMNDVVSKSLIENPSWNVNYLTGKRQNQPLYTLRDHVSPKHKGTEFDGNSASSKLTG